MRNVVFGGVFVLGFSGAGIVAQAQESGTVKIPQNGREQVTFFHARPKVQIVDDGPEVTDLRHREQGGNYNIVIPPLPSYQQSALSGLPPGTIIVVPNSAIPAGGIPFGGSSGSQSYPQIPGLRNLTPASFQSNVPVRGGVAPQMGLPQAQSTNLLGQLFKPAPGQKTVNPAKQMGKATNAPMTYQGAYGDNYLGSASSRRSGNATTSVSGRITRRGELLNKTN